MRLPSVHAAVRGDPDARRDLVHVHGPEVYRLCRRLSHDPDDAYQSVWEKVFAALPGFDPDGAAPFGRWLSVVTRRHLVDRFRRRTVRGHLQPVDELRSEGPGPEGLVEEAQRHERLARALAQLPDPLRDVVTAHHLNGEPLADIAHREGVALGTVKSRLHRGRARLADLLRSTP
jgi:RNA polymerase sigma-70 factor (ECF subfamily)